MQALPIQTVYISPFDMNMLYFAPEMRRNYMDDILVRAFDGFPRIKREYEMAVRQRNTLLKHIREGNAQEEGLTFWDVKVAELADLYGQYRRRYIGFIRTHMERYPEFFGVHQVEVEYQGEWFFSDDPQGYIQKYLYENRARDIFSGHTHIGPHRDDIMLTLSGES